MRLAVVGSRDITDQDAVNDAIAEVLLEYIDSSYSNDTVIVSGGARGVQACAKKYAEMKKISCSEEAEEVFRSIWSKKIGYVEEFMILCLNRANKVLGWSRISIGGVSGCVVDPKVIFQVALKSNSSNLIIAHNHPSGNLDPIREDRDITKRLKDAGEILGIPLLDYIIFIKNG